MKLLHFAFAALLAWCLASAAAAQPRFDFETTPGTLPKTALPLRYALALDLDPAAERFSGEARITLEVREPMSAIVLHAHELTARSAMLSKAGAAPRTLRVKADPKTQTWRLVPADGRAIPAGEHRLDIRYSGSVKGHGAGLFRAPHQAFGKPASMLATQLQAVHARTVFPAFDEPAFRTVFEVSVRTPKGFEVLSNMPAETAVDANGGHVVHRFAPTPPMPAYLLAVAVGRFDALGGSAAGVPLRILTSPGKREQGAYALQATQQLLPYFTQYFGVPYTLPKLDQLAVPSTRGGAMEDWGLISYTESGLLFDPARSDAQTKRVIFELVAHEVAHQWFGNLVTAASWEEIWLNEAFATWMAEKATARFNPEWQVPLRRRGAIEWAMGRDAGASTRAIRSGAVPEDRVSDVFDAITYSKGGAVLSMLESWIGEEAFRAGLADYMAARRLSNATAGDLWHHIGKAAGRDVAGVAASWTDQPGFPLVSVDSRCEDGRTRLTLSQQRFRVDAQPGNERWRIPLLLLHDGKRLPVLMEEAQQTVELPGCPALPTLVNPGGEGFYRVAYGPAAHGALAAAFAQLPAAAQVTLVSDTFALAQADRLPMQAWLELLPGVAQAQGPGRPALVASLRANLRFLDATLAGTPARPALHAAARALLAPDLAALGWTPRAGEGSEAELMRSQLIGELARYGDEVVVQQARALFDGDEAGRAVLHPGVRAGVVSAVGRHADARRFAQLVARLKAATSEEDREMYAQALAAVPDVDMARQVLALALNETLPNNTAIWLPTQMGDEMRHGDLAFRFTLENWTRLARRSGQQDAVWLLPGAAGESNEAGMARRLRADQQRLLGDKGASAAARAASRIELRAAVKAREASRVEPPLQALRQRLAKGGS